MKNFMQDIKTNNFKRVYLFFGDEDYLRAYYEKEAVNKITGGPDSMDLDIVDGKYYSISSFMRFYETPPFMANKRLVIFQDTGLFAAGKKNESEEANEYISKIIGSDEETFAVIIFSENKIDKRVRIYKTVEKAGGAVEFKRPTDKELIKWTANYTNKNGGSIGPEAATLLVGYVYDMNSLRREIDKLIAYKGFGGEIAASDVEFLCEKTLDIKIFALTSAIGLKDRRAAVRAYHELIMEKEYPVQILSMVTRQFGIILSVKEMSAQNEKVSEMAYKLGLRDFVVIEALKQSKLFMYENLTEAYAECLEMDFKIKTGRITDKLGVELLIIKYSAV